MNIENLATLRDFLLTNDVPFHMDSWREDDEFLTKDIIDKGVAVCNTSGCALGWAPFVIPAIDIDFYLYCDGVVGVDFHEYSDRVFSLNRYEDSSVFDSDWTLIDNSREGAAFRINQLVNGVVYDYRDLESGIEGDTKEYTQYITDRDAWLLTKGITL